MKKQLFTWNEESYTPWGLRDKSERDLRQEYSRLRSIAQKRLDRLIEAGIGKTSLYRQRKESFPLLKEITDNRNLRAHVVDLQRFLTSQSSTVTGVRKAIGRTIITLQERGLTWITGKNVHIFTDFMEWYRDKQMEDGGMGSPEVIEFLSKVKNPEEKSQERLRGEFLKWMETEQDEKAMNSRYLYK